MNYRALVADDEYAYRVAIARLLAPLGFACVEAADGVQGAALLADASQVFDVAITDFRMPRGSGWRVVEAARAHRGAAFPVIMQTAESQYADVYLVANELGVPLVAKRDLYTHLVPAVRAALGML
jgi:CheY-like chemotaxis protein